MQYSRGPKIIMAENTTPNTNDDTSAEGTETETVEAPEQVEAEVTDAPADQADTEDAQVEAAPVADEKPAPKRVVRKPRKAADEAPATEEKTDTEPKRRGRPRKQGPTKLDEPVLSGEVPADLHKAGAIPVYKSQTKRNQDRLADLRNNPVVTGATAIIALAYPDAEKFAETKAKIEKAATLVNTVGEFGAMVFLGTDKSGNVDWLVGLSSKRQAVRLREDKDGKITVGSIDLKSVEKTYNLSVMFDGVELDWWHTDEDRMSAQYNLGLPQKIAAAAKKAAAALKAKTEAAKSAPKAEAKAPTGKSRKVVRAVRKTPAMAGK